MDRARSGGRFELVAAVAIYTLLALVATWPLVLHFQDQVPGSEWWGTRRLHSEALLNLWNLWWFRHALLDLGQNPFDCLYLLYPYGVDLRFHTLAPLHGLAGIPLRAFAPLPAVQNLMLLFDLVAAGVCTFALARHAGLLRGGALLAGGIYAFAPAVFGHLYAGHYELIATYWLPAQLLLFLRLVEAPAPRLRDAFGLGLLFVGAAYSSLYYCVYGAELLGVALAIVGRRAFRIAALRALGLAGAVAAIGVGPLLWAFLVGDGTPPDAWRAALPDFEYYAGDLIGFALPSFTHPFLSSPLHALYERLNPRHFLPQETTTYVGWCVLGLAVLGGIVRRRARQPIALWLAIALVFACLSLGSSLKVWGEATGIPLPAAVLAQLPVVRLARAPARHIVVAMLGVGMLAGAGWESLRQRWLRGGLLALLVVEYAAMPLPLTSTQAAPVYQRLAEVPGRFAVLDIPTGVRDGAQALGIPDNAQIFGQVVHGHPIVSAAVARIPPGKWQAILAAPVIGTLLDPQGVTEAAYLRDLAEGADFFSHWSIEAIVLHPQASAGAHRRYLESVLPIRRVEQFADGSQLLWVGGL